MGDARARYETYVEELELWIALLVARHGDDVGGRGFHLEVDYAEVAQLRARLPRAVPFVIIGARTDGTHVLDVL